MVDIVKLELSTGPVRWPTARKLMLESGRSFRSLTKSYMERLLDIFLEGEDTPEYVMLGVGTRADQDDIDVGIIDEDYCGPEDEVKVALIKHYNPAEPADQSFVIEKGTRIAQLIFEKNEFPEIEWVEQDNPDFAGETRGGFGSTGSR